MLANVLTAHMSQLYGIGCHDTCYQIKDLKPLHLSSRRTVITLDITNLNSAHQNNVKSTKYST
jgi:hypothetical protein